MSARASRSSTSTVRSGAARELLDRASARAGRERREDSRPPDRRRRRAAPAAPASPARAGSARGVAGEQRALRGHRRPVLGRRRPRAARRRAGRPSRRPTGSGRRGRAPCALSRKRYSESKRWKHRDGVLRRQRELEAATGSPEVEAQHARACGATVNRSEATVGPACGDLRSLVADRAVDRAGRVADPVHAAEVDQLQRVLASG